MTVFGVGLHLVSNAVSAIIIDTAIDEGSIYHAV